MKTKSDRRRPRARDGPAAAVAVAAENQPAEKALEDSERRFRLAAMLATDVIYERDMRTGIAVFHGDIDAIQGFPPGGYPRDQEGFFNLLHPDDAASFAAAVGEMIATGKTFCAEFRIRRADGGYNIWIDHSCMIFDEQGLPRRWIGVATNVTERRRTEAALHENERLLANAVEIARLGYWEYDVAADLYRFNDHFYRFMRTTAEKEGGYTMSAAEYIRRFVHPDDAPAVAAGIRAGVESVDVEASVQAEHRVIFGDGAVGHIVVRLFFVRNEQGRTIKFYGVNQDITERKRAENALRESEERCRRLVQNSNDIIEIVDENGAMTYIGDTIDRILGYKPEELLGEIGFLRIHPADLPRVTAVFAGGLAEPGAVRTVEYRYRHKNGAWVDLEAIGCNLLQDPAVKGIVLNIRDITERKRADEESHAKTAILEAQINSMIDGILIVDPQGKKIIQNRRCVELWKIPENIAANDDDRQQMEFVRDRTKDPEKFVEKALYLYDHPDETSHDEVAFKDGTTLDRYSAPVIGANGLYFGRIWVFRDITNRKRQEEEIRGLAKFPAENPNPILRVGGDGVLLYVNESGLLRFAGLHLQTGQVVPDVLRGAASRALSAGLAEQFDFEHEGFIFSFFVAPFVASGYVNLYGHDVTARRRAEEEKLKLAGQLQQAMKMEAVGRLAGGVAHDFNNMLQVINSYAELSLGKLSGREDLSKNIQCILEAGQRAAGLTRQLLAFGRKQVLRPVVLDINGTIAGVEKMLRRLIGEDIEIVMVHGENLDKITADPGQIEQVLLNLAINSRDAMPQGGVLTIETANVQLDESYAAGHIKVAPGPHVMLAVSDTGCGMDDATKALVFEPFFTTKEKGKGTGLGLATVYGVVKQSGGNIWVYSEPGRGTTFKIYFPSATSNEATARDMPATELLAGTETIMLVEDEDSVRELLRQILKAAGYDVFACADPAEALLASERHENAIHLLLTDVVMPQMSGTQLARRLSTLRPETKVLFMSGYTDDAIGHHGVLGHGTHFISKPFTAAALTLKIREVLDAT